MEKKSPSTLLVYIILGLTSDLSGLQSTTNTNVAPDTEPLPIQISAEQAEKTTPKLPPRKFS
jgi:hypothetical protein